MTLTVLQLLSDALGLIGAIEIDETPSSSELEKARRTANVMIDRWSSQHLMLRSSSSIVFTTTPNQASYTIGLSGSNIIASKPLRINYATVTDNSIDYSLDVIPKSLYDSYQDKNVTFSRPNAIVYDPDDAQQSVQKGTLYLYYTPDKAYTVTLDVDLYLTEFDSFADTVNFEPAYYECIIYNLAVRLFRMYNGPNVVVPSDIMLIANNSLNNIKVLNHERVMADCDIPGSVKTSYNIYTDSF